ncbi:MAG: TetR/AcrR family transcriptional regulator [Roseiflexaceae bacterium]|nr:TetR/AcrR family transcriptional regulator [Roseiflexaceae bacterium]
MTNDTRDQQRQQLRDDLRERRRQQMRDEIISAARLLLEEKGYAATLMDDIAVRAGISKPTLYGYFATKDALIVAIIVQHIGLLLEMAEPSSQAGTPLQRLARILDTVVRLQMHDRREPIRLWMPEFYKLSTEHAEMMDAMQRLDSRFVALVLEGVALGEIDGSLDPATVVRVFYALITAIRFLPHSSIGEPDTEGAPRTIARIFAAGVAPR